MIQFVVKAKNDLSCNKSASKTVFQALTEMSVYSVVIFCHIKQIILLLRFIYELKYL